MTSEPRAAPKAQVHELQRIDHELPCADDIALLGDSFEAVQEALEGVECIPAVVGLRINAARTKVLSTQMAVLQQKQLSLE